MSDDLTLMPVGRDENLAGKVYRQLRQALMRGRLRPGQRLVHRVVAADLKVSLTPVREALLRLASEGALTLDARGIAVVPHLPPERYAEILALRIELEGRAAEAAARRADPEAVAAMAAIHARLAAAKAAGALEAVLAENEAFHFALIELAAMPVLAKLVESLWMQCGPTIRLRYERPAGAPPGQHPHLALLAALRRHDAAAARAAIVEDLQGNGRVLLELLSGRADPA
ncbi:GntR family transcriptional regulator [Roseomonas sp. NAR14]|uniref:GntR family transcriptional regulator n=1 Tax=Roseomonas acroporae TaxID=2937791 RepID=A0A9X1Y6G6_9PROT|nr:GntR family transcriptional regulator [Roseomonas acroporae]MCK8784413.1 GntR family transcriptional regulator [Roseomonas acroporae]